MEKKSYVIECIHSASTYFWLFCILGHSRDPWEEGSEGKAGNVVHPPCGPVD